MDDLRISKAPPTVKCLNRNQSVHTKQLRDQNCTPAPRIPKQPIAIDTSTALRGRKLSNKSNGSVSPSSGSKFNFQFWTGKAKDVLRNVNRKNPNSSLPSSVEYPHAITTSISEEVTASNSMRKSADHHPIYDRMVHKRYNSPPADPVRISPIATSSTPLSSASKNDTHSPPSHIMLHRRKNSTSPAPFVRHYPERAIVRNPRLSETHSTSSSEGPHSPRTPNATMRYPLESFLKVQKQPCLRCHREVAEDADAVRVTLGVYHTRCFSCHTCRKSLDPHQRPLEYEGRVYCEIDYETMAKQPPCGACGEPIAPHVRPTRALGKLYHPEHLRCYHCSKPVDPDMTGLVEHKNRIFCRPDFNALYLPKCPACGRAVEKEAVSSADGKLLGRWHKHCFNCHACHEPFTNNVFYVYNNMPYCRRDYHKMNNSLCKKCNEPVEGRCAQTSEGWRFHPQCFKCSVCNTYIADVYYASENSIFCANDRKHQLEKRHTLFE